MAPIAAEELPSRAQNSRAENTCIVALLARHLVPTAVGLASEAALHCTLAQARLSFPP
jgi:hypothetical protein